MTELSTGVESLQAALAEGLQSFAGHFPNIVAALLLLIVGWLAGRALRGISLRLGTWLNTFIAGFGRWTRPGRSVQLTSAVLALIGNVIFWLTVLVFIALAARVAELELFTDWLDQIISYLPTLLAGGLIVLAGYLVSTVARDVVAATLESAGSQQGDAFGRLAQGAVFIAALVIGLNQIGVDVTFLTMVFGIGLAGLLLSMALAFGLGANVFVSNLLGSQQIRNLLEPGQMLRVRDTEGRVIELTATSVLLATNQGRVSVPARVFQEEVTIIVTIDDDG